MSQKRFTKKRTNRRTGQLELWDNIALTWLLLADVPVEVDTDSIPTVNHVSESDAGAGTVSDSVDTGSSMDTGSSSSYDTGSSFSSGFGSDSGSSFGGGGGFDGGGMGGF